MRCEMTHVSMSNARAAARAFAPIVENDVVGTKPVPAWSRIRNSVRPTHVGLIKFDRPGGRGGAS